MANEVTLLSSWVSNFGVRVQIALAEKGIEYEYKEEQLQAKSDLLLKLNPVHKKIPVLIHNGKPICESLIIVQYIDEVWNDKSPLMPQDPYKRATARFWADFVDKKIYPSVSKVWSAAEGEELAAAKNEFVENLKLLEGELGEKPYFGGESFGFLDLALIPFYSWFYTIEYRWKFSTEDECPTLVAWAKRCMERESVSKSVADQQKLFEMVKKYLGFE